MIPLFTPPQISPDSPFNVDVMHNSLNEEILTYIRGVLEEVFAVTIRVLLVSEIWDSSRKL